MKYIHSRTCAHSQVAVWACPSRGCRPAPSIGNAYFQKHSIGEEAVLQVSSNPTLRDLCRVPSDFLWKHWLKALLNMKLHLFFYFGS